MAPAVDSDGKINSWPRHRGARSSSFIKTKQRICELSAALLSVAQQILMEKSGDAKSMSCNQMLKLSCKVCWAWSEKAAG